MIFMNKERKARLAGQPKTLPRFSTNIINPPQHNANFMFAVGAVIGGAAGGIGSCYGYDLAHIIDPNWTRYAYIQAFSWPTWKIIAGEALNLPFQILKHQMLPANWSYVLLSGTALGSIIGAVSGYTRFKIQPEIHRSGFPLVTAHQIPALPGKEQLGIWIGPVQLSLREEREGIVLIGSQGAGKTTVINQIVQQAIARGDCIVMVDLKGDYFIKYKNSAYYIAPWRAGSARWQLGKDIRDDGAYMAFAQTFIQPGGNDPVWAETAQQICIGFCQKLKAERGEKWGWLELADEFRALAKRQDELSEILLPYREILGEKLKEMDSKLRDSIILNLIAPAQLILDAGKMEQKLVKPKWWSVTDWLSGDKPFAILGWDDSQRALCEKLITPLFSQVVQRLISPDHPEQAPDGNKYWIVCDELTRLKLPDVDALFTATRSKGGRPVVGFQHVSDLKEEMNGNFASVLSAEILLLGKQKEASERRESAEQAGIRVVDRYTTTTNADGSRSHSWQVNDNAFVYPPSAFNSLGRDPAGKYVKFLFCGRNVRSEVRFFFDQKRKQ